MLDSTTLLPCQLAFPVPKYRSGRQKEQIGPLLYLRAEVPFFLFAKQLLDLVLTVSLYLFCFRVNI